MAPQARTSTELARGIGLATLAALLFGVTAPFLKVASAGVGVFAGAALLYAGAAAGAGLRLAVRRPVLSLRGAGGRGALARLGLVALFGAVCAPALLIAGLARTDGATASLVLVLEAPFTAVLAAAFLREHLGRRVLVALAFVSSGAFVLAFGAPAGPNSVVGLALVAAAALAWAADNLVSRTLADADPGLVVALKGLLGGAAAAATAALAREPLPSAARAAALLALGAVGYGVSLGLYLRAQALVGAARTASVFATAPFIGAVGALVLGTAMLTWQLPVAGALMLVGVVLHVFETHRHRHTHEPLAHEHLHTHDDGHHTHTHVPMPVGPHAHPHQHEAATHEHDHSEDLHHRHAH